jgi:beta-phosphoglucomutase-like phosphatase (HAD superfamily)
MVLASSSKMQLIKLVAKKLELDRYFSSYISGDELPRSKPDPAIYLNAVETIGLSANQCVAIEDSSNGVKSAKAAEIFCIAFRNDHFGKQNLELADWEVSEMSSITPMELIKRFQA